MPREANTWADRLCHIASHKTGDGIVCLRNKIVSEDPVHIDEDLVAYRGHSDTGG